MWPSNICIGLFAEKGELKSSSLQKHKEGQKQPAKETTRLKKRRLLLAPGVVVAEGRGEVGVVVGKWEPGVLITSPCDSVLVSEGYAQKAGVN